MLYAAFHFQCCSSASLLVLLRFYSQSFTSKAHDRPTTNYLLQCVLCPANKDVNRSWIMKSCEYLRNSDVCDLRIVTFSSKFRENICTQTILSTLNSADCLSLQKTDVKNKVKQAKLKQKPVQH